MGNRFLRWQLERRGKQVDEVVSIQLLQLPAALAAMLAARAYESPAWLDNGGK